MATIDAGLGDRDKALESLEKAWQERAWGLPWSLKVDFQIDSLNSDSRFRELASSGRVGQLEILVRHRV